MAPVETFWARAARFAHCTRAGRIDGLLKDGVTVFRGIPFAAAPLGPLRWSAPQRHVLAHPDGFDATHWGATAQRLSPGWDIPEPIVPGEDTLNLNVFAPVDALTAGPACPVLVWIHGGAYKSGTAISSWYDGRAFASAGVVVVSISYRVGFDGFAHLDGVPDNRGALDWIAALEWVQDHIAEFGGDPARVTIAGQSAGGGAVLALLSTARARGLFQRAWSLSGVLEAEHVSNAPQRTARFARGLQLTSSSAESFSTLSDRFLQQALVVLPGDLPFPPVEGEALFPDGISAGLSESAHIPLVLGATADEVQWSEPDPLAGEAARALLHEAGVPSEAAATFLSTLGREADPTESRIKSELYFRSPIVEVSRRRSAGDCTFRYDYRWGPAPHHRALHCNEIPVFFGVTDEPTASRVLGRDIPPAVHRFHEDAVRYVRDGTPPAHAIDGITFYGSPGGDRFTTAAPLAERWTSAHEPRDAHEHGTAQPEPVHNTSV
jgi:para-nitrobenzyl esterase